MECATGSALAALFLGSARTFYHLAVARFGPERALDRTCVGCGGTFRPRVGRQRYCSRACYEATNHETRLQGSRERYRRDRARRLAIMRAWYLAHRSQQLERAAKWKRENPELRRVYNAARRARAMTGAAASVSLEALAALPRMCAYCGRDDVRLTLGHRVPLNRGGRHELSNLVWACANCNSRKADRDELEFRALLAYEALVAGRTRRSIQEPPCGLPSRRRGPLLLRRG